jgi:hypothetical protein
LAKLGQHAVNYRPKCLSNIIQKSGPIAVIDCIIVKKYPIYYTEYSNKTENSFRYTRSRETVEYL